jgi:hypothetical protein
VLTGVPAPGTQGNDTEDAPLGMMGKYLQQLESTLQVVVRIARFLRIHWKVAAISAAAGLVWFSAWVYAYLGPARFFERYCDLIVRRDFAGAWDCIHPSFQRSWESDFTQFAKQYETTIAVVSQEIAPVQGRPFNPVSLAAALLAKRVQYDVVNEVTDRVLSRHCSDSDPDHHVVCLAAQLADKDAFQALKNDDRKMQHLKRVFKKRYTLDRESITGDWRIVDIQHLEVRIPQQKSRS